MTVWMYVTMDKYELPIYVADSAKELAQLVGTSTKHINSAIWHAKQRNGRCKYVKVNIDDINEYDDINE